MIPNARAESGGRGAACHEDPLPVSVSGGPKLALPPPPSAVTPLTTRNASDSPLSPPFDPPQYAKRLKSTNGTTSPTRRRESREQSHDPGGSEGRGGEGRLHGASDGPSRRKELRENGAKDRPPKSGRNPGINHPPGSSQVSPSARQPSSSKLGSRSATASSSKLERSASKQHMKLSA